MQLWFRLKFWKFPFCLRLLYGIRTWFLAKDACPMLSIVISTVTNILAAALTIAFFTLLERKVLGYFQLRKGPNKVGLAGIPQPFADVLKLFTKERPYPTISNSIPFIVAPLVALSLALILWSIYPHQFNHQLFPFRIILFLVVSSLSVYPTLAAGWASNSKYSLLGALRSIAQTISYEISISLTLLVFLALTKHFSFCSALSHQKSWPALLALPLMLVWFITNLAETNRAPFDFAEGESEIVSGFNIEYRGGPFALLFMAEYISILVIRLFTSILFFPTNLLPMAQPLIITLLMFFFVGAFLWARGRLPRTRYDLLISLTWKAFLPISLRALILISSLNCKYSKIVRFTYTEWTAICSAVS